jgi:two-component system phosphate regulon sensor histidine kinase PhoR
MVFLLPALFFSGYELSSLNKDEALIQDVYNKQLDAILFSVNQYSDDVLTRWISQVELGLDAAPDTEAVPPSLENLLQLNPSLSAAFMIDSANQQIAPVVYSQDTLLKAAVLRVIQTSLAGEREKIQQLLSYKRSGFQKIEAMSNLAPKTENAQWLMFILEDHLGRPHLAGVVIHPEIFVEDVVGPRLQAIARDRFILSVVRKGTNTVVYSTDRPDSVAINAEALTREFWLFPDYALGIRTRGSSIQAVISERTRTNMILLLTLDLALVLAVVLVFRNVKKEVQLAQNKSDFVSNVSHEIRTPLALISMFAETLEMGRVKTEEKKQEYYSIINKETHRLSGIVNKILNFSQAEANMKKLHLEAVHPDTEIKEVLKTYAYHLTNKGFEYDYAECPDLWIQADRDAFVEVVINLIDNAIKYSAERKRIEVSCRRENSLGVVAVKDFGVGISRVHQKHIFDKFYRVSSGNLAKSLGTGLGLSLVKQLMDGQYGKITVSSEPGKGSTFSLYFPLPVSEPT